MKKTFTMGGIHPNDNKIASEAPLEVFPVVETAYISMAQHLGAPATPVVAKGDSVKVGQVIGEPSGFISGFVHSSVSGTVKDVVPVADLAGNPVMHVVINVEGDEWCEDIDRTDTIKREIEASAEEIIAKVKACGIVGMGGATFPAHVKLAPPKDKTAEFLILNGAECEPYVTADDRLMREHAEEIVIGAMIMKKALGNPKVFIGIEDNKPAAIKAMTEAAKGYDAVVLPLKKKYPQGGEKQLIKAVTGREVRSGGLPIDVGAVVQNVATSFAVYQAVQKNRPTIDRAMTVTGQCLPAPKNLIVRLGTPYSKIMEYVGGIPEGAAKVISGGPMMGKAVANMEASTGKGTSCLTILTEAQTKRSEESNCIRCAKCASACPMGLEPFLFNRLARMGGKYDELEHERIYDCIECGCCSFTCPANIPLLDLIRINKAEVMKIMRSRPKK